MFWFIAAAVAGVVAVGYLAYEYFFKENEPAHGEIVIQNPPETKGTFQIKCKNVKKMVKPLMITGKENLKKMIKPLGKENSEVRQRKINDSKKEKDVKKVEDSEEKKKHQEKAIKNNIKKKIAHEKKLRESQRKKAPVCPIKTLCEEKNCKKESNILCSECNIYLCKDCYKNKDLKPGFHCIETETMQKIIHPIICENEKNGTHPMDCFLKKCKHVFHKSCLVKFHDRFQKCLTCVDEGIPTELFKLTETDIATDFFDPTKYQAWKSYPAEIYKPKKKEQIVAEEEEEPMLKHE